MSVPSTYADISANDVGTDVTAAELEELTDGSETTLHTHPGSGEVFTTDDITPVTDLTVWYQPTDNRLNLLIDNQWVTVNGASTSDGGSSNTFDHGLTETAGNVQLGGLFVNDETIIGDSTSGPSIYLYGDGTYTQSTYKSDGTIAGGFAPVALLNLDLGNATNGEYSTTELYSKLTLGTGQPQSLAQIYMYLNNDGVGNVERTFQIIHGDGTQTLTVDIPDPADVGANLQTTLPISVNGNYADAAGNITVSGSSVNFGTAEQIPYTNGSGNNFLYNAAFLYDSNENELNVGKVRVTDYFAITETTEPGSILANQGLIYGKADGKLYYKNDQGTEVDLTATGGSSPWSSHTNGITYQSGNVGIGVNPYSQTILAMLTSTMTAGVNVTVNTTGATKGIGASLGSDAGTNSYAVIGSNNNSTSTAYGGYFNADVAAAGTGFGVGVYTRGSLVDILADYSGTIQTKEIASGNTPPTGYGN